MKMREIEELLLMCQDKLRGAIAVPMEAHSKQRGQPPSLAIWSTGKEYLPRSIDDWSERTATCNVVL